MNDGLLHGNPSALLRGSYEGHRLGKIEGHRIRSPGRNLPPAARRVVSSLLGPLLDMDPKTGGLLHANKQVGKALYITI